MWKLTFLQIHNVNWHYNNFLKENMNTYDIDKIITYTKYIFIYIFSRFETVNMFN